MLRENDFRPLASLASCGKRGVLAGAVAVTRSQQKTVNFVGTCLQGDARDLSARIVAECLDQKQGGISGNQGIEVRHHAVLPEEGTFVPVDIERPAYHLAFAVDANGCTRNVSRKRAEVPHHTVLPEESVKGCVAGQVRGTDDLTLIVDVKSIAQHRASEVAEVGCPAVLPEQGVVRSQRVYAQTREADGLTSVVDRRSLSVRVSSKCRKFLDVAVSPDDRLKLQNLGGDRGIAGWVWRGNLRLPGDLAPAVNSGDEAVIASQRRQRGHHPLLPEKWETYKVGAENAKILPQRVWSGSIRTTPDFVALVGSKRPTAVRTSQRAEVGHHALLPEEGVRSCVSGQGRKSCHRVSVVHARGEAKRPAECAEVCDGEASMLRGQLKGGYQHSK